MRHSHSPSSKTTPCVWRPTPCAMRQFGASQPVVKVWRQDHAPTSCVGFIGQLHASGSSAAINVEHSRRASHVTRHGSNVNVMRRSHATQLEVTPHSQPSFSESQSRCGAPRQGQAPRSYLIVLVKAKATAIHKLMRRRFVVAVRATSTPSESCVNVRVMRRLQGVRVKRQPS